MRLLFPLLLTAAGAALSGCPKPPLGVVDSGQLKRIAPAEAADFLGRAANCSKDIESARARAKVVARKFPGQRQELTQVVAFRRPDRLRIEFFATGLNRLMSIITTSGGELSAANLPKRIFYRGSASAENLLKLLTVPFEPEEAMMWFTASYYPSGNYGRSAVFRADGGRLLVEHALADGRTVGVLYRPQSNKKALPDRSCPQAESLYAKDNEGEVVFSSVYKYRELPSAGEGAATAALKGVRARIESLSLELVVDYLLLDLNPQWGENSGRIFDLKPPRGSTVVLLDGANAEAAISPYLHEQPGSDEESGF